MSRWVQHKSGVGEKWEVNNEHTKGWKVLIPEGFALGDASWFPKSEYIECSPPEEYGDVNVTQSYKRFIGDDLQELTLLASERFRYVEGEHNGPALVIVERRKV